MKYPNIMHVDNLERHIEENTAEISVDVPNSNKKVRVPARPVGFPSIGQRFKAAYLVFTGKADALMWRGQ